MHNRLLLQQLLSVLRHVLERSDTNKMDARNLAVCIAPTLLQLNATPLEEQKEKLEKVRNEKDSLSGYDYSRPTGSPPPL